MRGGVFLWKNSQQDPKTQSGVGELPGSHSGKPLPIKTHTLPQSHGENGSKMRQNEP